MSGRSGQAKHLPLACVTRFEYLIGFKLSTDFFSSTQSCLSLTSPTSRPKLEDITNVCLDRLGQLQSLRNEMILSIDVWSRRIAKIMVLKRPLLAAMAFTILLDCRRH
ncbi:hypothetical protein FVE85_8882 [Porphyridium purpureum]|uniref:Uncharacterized protein n=1 Tax=Porphyridium purpureum TaxID=35688 RepID=A0A5J4YSM8_PORPP|nr:hypothetical protein FVE85_8882 [Porphyridium purpureum]|eukprot:POR8549..scf296_7